MANKLTNGTTHGTGKKYFRSLDEVAQTPRFKEFLEREFPVGASEWLGASRRTVLKILGASAALAGLASCRRWPAEQLAPYAHRPANRSDGVPVHYATATEIGGVGIGLVAKSYDGRPTKIEGNVNHPLSAGASSTLIQASVLDLYDPDRSRNLYSHDKSGKSIIATWDEFIQASEKIPADGNGLVVLSEASRSPSIAALRKKLPQAKWFEYEAVSTDAQRAAAKKLYGRPLRAVPSIDKAQVVVAVEADLFAGDLDCIKYSRDFAAGRKLHASPDRSSTMNRLWCIESTFSNTGANADHRRGVKPSEVFTVAGALLQTLGGTPLESTKLDPSLRDFVQKLAADLEAHKGQSVLIAGARASADVHAITASLNELLGNVGKTVHYYADPEDPRSDTDWTPHSQQLQAFNDAATTADALLIIGANIAYTAPSDLKIPETLAKAKLSIHLGTHRDETARLCTWHLPQAHYLEAWGDVRTFDSTVSITQPLIEPIFGAKSTIEILSILSREKKSGYDIVRETAAADYLAGRFSEWNWKKSLFDGLVAGSARAPETIGKSDAFTILPAPSGGDLELTFITDKLHDGRYANNGWLMELPDPMTRLTWDNALLISEADAKKRGIWNNEIVTITVGSTNLDATIFVLPGQPVGSVALALGYGRTSAGSVGNAVGTNAYLLRTSSNYLYIPQVTLASTGRKNDLASVQDHNVIDAVGAKRKKALIPELVVEGTFADYVHKPALGTRKVVSLSMFNEHKYDQGHKWGLAIDLTTCTGCSACVIACQAENNIPIVGKRQVLGGREMHWLRIDRYFKHEGDHTQALHQPVMCFHCENAPCEEVCPVAATTHSDEGLNMMTYNRCIGTRYCSNNCPYKVRRFNFFDFNSGTIENQYIPNLLRAEKSELIHMQKNPEVTVRSRGVMEKCSYCVQRIEGARIKLRAENRATANDARIADGSIQTACQQSCPTGAIVFGDLNDPHARVTKLHALAQSYGLLDPELNTKPRTQFLAKVRNPLPDLDAELYRSEDEAEGFYWQHTEHSATPPAEHSHPDDHSHSASSASTPHSAH